MISQLVLRGRLFPLRLLRVLLISLLILLLVLRTCVLLASVRWDMQGFFSL